LLDFAGSGTPTDADALLGELKSSDGDDLPLDILSVNEDSLKAHHIDDSDQFALERSVVDSGYSADFDELVIDLHRHSRTIVLVVNNNDNIQYSFIKYSIRAFFFSNS